MIGKLITCWGFAIFSIKLSCPCPLPTKTSLKWIDLIPRVSYLPTLSHSRRRGGGVVFKVREPGNKVGNEYTLPLASRFIADMIAELNSDEDSMMRR